VNSLANPTISLALIQPPSNQHLQQPTSFASLDARQDTTLDTNPIAIDSNPTAQTTTQIPPEKIPGKFGQVRKENPDAPQHPTVLYLTVTTLSSTNTTLAGVAQSVERVALITAKRSTSRSWVRAPPSAIPII
jgi:hypothetical protein